MSGWASLTFGELATFQEGYVNPKQGTPGYFDGPIKWLRAVDLNDGFVRDTSRTLTQEGFNSAGKSALLFEPDTIAISKSGTIGRLGILKDYMCGNRAVINIRPKNGVCDLRFLFYALRHNYEAIIQRAEGSVQKNLYVSALSGVTVSAPNITTQREIASILGALDDKIELNRRMSATLEDMARSLYRSWFVDFDPVHAKMEGRQPAFMDETTAALFPDRFGDDGLPQGWSVGTLRDIATLNPEKLTDKRHPETVDYVDLSNTKWGVIETTNAYSWDKAPSRARMVLRANDTIVGTVRPGNGSYSYVGMDGLTGSTGFAVLRPVEITDNALVYLCATDADTIESLANLADGGAYPAVRPDVVAAQPVVLAKYELRVKLKELCPLRSKKMRH